MTRNTLEQHVVSLELAKQLKEAGYPQQKSTMVWLNGTDGWEVAVNMFDGGFVSMKANWGYIGEGDTFAALLASELGEELPKGFRSGRGDFIYCYLEFNGAVDANGRKHNGSAHEIGDTEADARAKMWLYLKKEGLL